jgi:predicted nucleotidyltransferase
VDSRGRERRGSEAVVRSREPHSAMLEPAVLARLIDATAGLFPDRGVLVAYAFGSRVAGCRRPESDLDVGYYLNGYREGIRLPVAEEMLLAGRLSGEVGLEIDLRDLADASLEFRGRVLEEGIRIYEGHPAARVALECELLARYHDYKPVFRWMHERRLRALAERGL